MADTHVQCKLRKKEYIPYCEGIILTDWIYAYQTSWIPKKYAIVGKYVRLKTDNEDRPWDDGWEVMETGTELDSKTVTERSMDYRKQRRASDI